MQPPAGSMEHVATYPPARLALPFAVLAAATAHSGMVLLGATLTVIVPGRELLGAAFGFPAGFVVGAVTTWLLKRSRRAAASRAAYAYATLSVVTLVVAASLGIAISTAGFGSSPPDGALHGLSIGIAAAPFVCIVFWSARRAQRARLGSLVAQFDERALYRTVCLVICLVSLATLGVRPQSSAFLWQADLRPLVVFVLGSGAVVLATCIGDALGMRRLTRLIVRTDREFDPARPHLTTTDAPVTADAGLGDDVTCRYAERDAGYRGRRAVVELVRGDLEVARATADRARRFGLLQALGISITILVHGVGALPHALVQCGA